MRRESYSVTLSKVTYGRLLIACVLSLLSLSQAALAQSGRRTVKKEPPTPAVSVEAQSQAEREKPKSDTAQVDTSQQLQSAEWQLVTPAGEEFTVLMPPLSSVYYGSRYMHLGNDTGQSVTIGIYRALTDEALFVVQSFYAPNLKALVEDTVKSNKQLSFGSDTKLDGFKGEPFKRKSLSIFSKGRYFVTKKHVYVIEAIRRGGDDASLDKFLDSFRLAVSDPPTKLKVAPKAEPEVILNSREVTRKAMILWRPAPTYNVEGRVAGVTGRLSLKALLSANGSVSEVEVLSGLRSGLNEQAIEAAKTIIFMPGEKDGKYVSQRVIIEYAFQIY